MVNREFHAWLLGRWYGERPIRLFIPLAGVFALVTTVRRWCYRHGIFKSVNLATPVIVVGNITVGGTGKTPFVIWLAEALQGQGLFPGIITRGYRGKSKRWPLRVTPTTDPALAGDEAVLLAQRTRLPVMAGSDRVEATRRLLNEAQVNVIVSDDGLQHYRLGRSLEIVMMDGTRGVGNGWPLPAGPLREPRSRLDKVNLVVCKTRRFAGAAPNTAVMHLELDSAISLADGASRPLAEFSGQPVHAVAGIGNPEQFFSALEGAGLKVDRCPLPDHVEPSERDMRFDDAAPILMTEKDAVKYRAFRLSNHWYVPVAARFSERDRDVILNGVQNACAPAFTKLMVNAAEEKTDGC